MSCRGCRRHKLGFNSACQDCHNKRRRTQARGSSQGTRGMVRALTFPLQRRLPRGDAARQLRDTARATGSPVSFHGPGSLVGDAAMASGAPSGGAGARASGARRRARARSVSGAPSAAAATPSKGRDAHDSGRLKPPADGSGVTKCLFSSVYGCKGSRNHLKEQLLTPECRGATFLRECHNCYMAVERCHGLDGQKHARCVVHRNGVMSLNPTCEERRRVLASMGLTQMPITRRCKCKGQCPQPAGDAPRQRNRPRARSAAAAGDGRAPTSPAGVPTPVPATRQTPPSPSAASGLPHAEPAADARPAAAVGVRLPEADVSCTHLHAPAHLPNPTRTSSASSTDTTGSAGRAGSGSGAGPSTLAFAPMLALRPSQGLFLRIPPQPERLSSVGQLQSPGGIQTPAVMEEFSRYDKEVQRKTHSHTRASCTGASVVDEDDADMDSDGSQSISVQVRSHFKHPLASPTVQPVQPLQLARPMQPAPALMLGRAALGLGGVGQRARSGVGAEVVAPDDDGSEWVGNWVDTEVFVSPQHNVVIDGDQDQDQSRWQDDRDVDMMAHQLRDAVLGFAFPRT